MTYFAIEENTMVSSFVFSSLSSVFTVGLKKTGIFAFILIKMQVVSKRRKPKGLPDVSQSLRVPANLPEIGRLFKENWGFEGLYKDKYLVNLRWVFERFGDDSVFELLPFDECLALCGEVLTLAMQCADVLRAMPSATRRKRADDCTFHLQSLLSALSASRTKHDLIEIHLNSADLSVAGISQRLRAKEARRLLKVASEHVDSDATNEHSSDESQLENHKRRREFHRFAPFFHFDTAALSEALQLWTTVADARYLPPMGWQCADGIQMLPRVVAAMHSTATVANWYFDKATMEGRSTAKRKAEAMRIIHADSDRQSQHCFESALRSELRMALFSAAFAQLTEERAAVSRTDDELCAYIRAVKIELRCELLHLRQTKQALAHSLRSKLKPKATCLRLLHSTHRFDICDAEQIQALTDEFIRTIAKQNVIQFSIL